MPKAYRQSPALTEAKATCFINITSCCGFSMYQPRFPRCYHNNTICATCVKETSRLFVMSLCRLPPQQQPQKPHLISSVVFVTSSMLFAIMSRQFGHLTAGSRNTCGTSSSPLAHTTIAVPFARRAVTQRLQQLLHAALHASFPAIPIIKSSLNEAV